MSIGTSVSPHDPPVAAGAARGRTLGRQLTKSPLALIGSSIILFFLVIAILAPWLAPYNPIKPDLNIRLLPPGPHHPFGTDSVGMDIYSRVLYGTRIDLAVSVSIVALAASLGMAIGVIAAWAGGWWDEILMRITDMFLAFPSLILAMAISAILKPSLTNALLAITVTYWPIYARLSRGQVLTLKRLEYVEAAQALGASAWTIIGRHLVPNALTTVLVQATLDMGNVLLIAAGLSFIGFGAQPPTPEWGTMVAQGSQYLMTQWWIATFPALAIFILVLGFNLFGDGLRDLLDPRTRRRS